MADRKRLRRLAKQSAPFMFAMSLIFLANTATLIVLWVDVPRLREAYGASLESATSVDRPVNRAATLADDLTVETRALQLGLISLGIAGVLWPVFLIEHFLYRFCGGASPRHDRSGLWSCLFPPLRLAAPNHALAHQIWLPWLGWSRVNDSLRERLERAFGWPMILIALMILPILLVEYCLQDHIAEHRWLRILLHVSTGTIWFAFSLEFILMWSVAERKLQYCREHWLDIVIILLPLISFLRSLRLVRATRLARLAKVQHLTKISRVYHLRGLTIKGLRAALLFDVLNRLVGTSPEKQLHALQYQLRHRKREVESLQRRIAELEHIVAERQQLGTRTDSPAQQRDDQQKTPLLHEEGF
jgi:voltage-gated potassium channel